MFRKLFGPKSSDQFYPVNNSLDNMCPEELKNNQKLMEEKIKWPQMMLACTGLLYTCERRPIWRAVRIFVCLSLTLLDCYQFGACLKILLRSTDFNGIYFLLANSRLFATAAGSHTLFKGLPAHRFSDKACLISVWRKFAGDTEADQLVDESIFEIYGNKKMAWLVFVVYTWAFFVLVAVLTFFVCVVTALHHELAAFNSTKLSTIGKLSAEGDDMEAIANQLQEHYVTHVELVNRVRNIDKMFEVYIFVMIGTNVPSSIVCVLFFLLSFQSSSWFGLFLSIPDLAFCLLELMALVSTPAKVYARIREVENIVYGNMRIWTPFSDKVYCVASVFVSHANQANLGITLWGFAVITKPLILTMISLTVTYLTFVIQFHDDKEKKMNNGTNFG
uniref:Gustatory receptor n=1 Tax=Globodera rostochiensis TaxID=31243 RepID=A0A914I2Y5_GLORO